jgi:hypothetical protein
MMRQLRTGVLRPAARGRADLDDGQLGARGPRTAVRCPLSTTDSVPHMERWGKRLLLLGLLVAAVGVAVIVWVIHLFAGV